MGNHSESVNHFLRPIMVKDGKLIDSWCYYLMSDWLIAPLFGNAVEFDGMFVDGVCDNYTGVVVKQVYGDNVVMPDGDAVKADAEIKSAALRDNLRAASAVVHALGKADSMTTTIQEDDEQLKYTVTIKKPKILNNTGS